eukprot:m.148470 g.148470  ORF g.148470 m.148470 type:complete len:57 (+) comp38498_c1_seq17:394-564(+)
MYKSMKHEVTHLIPLSILNKLCPLSASIKGEKAVDCNADSRLAHLEAPEPWELFQA